MSTQAPAPLTKLARKALRVDCDFVEINGHGVIADVLRALVSESERADLAINEVTALRDRVRWLEQAVEGLAARLDEADGRGRESGGRTRIPA